ncbi:MAG: transglycosylase domain-containing protein, partial [Kiloniellales bacterium]
MRSSRRRRRPAGRKRSLIRTLLYGGLLFTVWSVVALGGLLAYYAWELPEVSMVGEVERRPSVTFLAADGTVFATYGDLYGATVSVHDLPAVLIQAVLATEDRRFYDHFGIDIIGLARAAWVNLRAGEIRQGGSTITQQLAKNLFLNPERTVERKVQEMMLALLLEHRFDKDQILTIYLNRIYLGAGTYGVEAAAQRYFAKSARQVGLYEAATLAGLLKAPSRYNPVRNPRLARRRTEQVLAKMVDAGYLSDAEAAAVVEPPVRRRRVAIGQGSRYFADWVMERLGGYIHLGDRNVTVRTTLDLNLQRTAEGDTAALIAGAKDRLGAVQAALVALAPDGAVRAMVGGHDYQKSQFNRATQALRQPGSAFKAFVYLAGLERGLSPDTVIHDTPISIGGWRPRNYEDKHYGRITLREALARSINTVAVQVSERAGRRRVVEIAQRLGVTSKLKAHPSLALGTSEVTLIELTAAYGAFANGGQAVWPYAIEEVRDAGGKLLYRRFGSGPGQVVDARGLRAMNDMLTTVMTRGTGRSARLDRPAAGKTGTSQEYRDAWFIGYTA